MLMTVEGIVIKAIDYGEGNKIITLFTKNNGKIAILARGAKKTRSRLNILTQVFCYGKYIYFINNQASMGTLNQGDVEKHFDNIYKDITKTSYAAYLVELVDKLTEVKQPNPNLFEQLLSSLEHINAGKEEEIVARIFEMKIFQIFGYNPHLQSCSICKEENDIVAFSIISGGLVCSKHTDDRAIIIQPNTIKLLRIFESMDIRRLGNIDIKQSTKDQLKLITENFFDEYIGIPLKSRNFLEQLKKFEN